MTGEEDKKELKARLDNLTGRLRASEVKGLPPALGLCEQCTRKTPTRLNNQLPAIYCKHNKAGAIFMEILGVWQIFHPVELDEFGIAVGVATATTVHNAQAEAPPTGERH